MTSMPTPDAPTMDEPLDPELQARVGSVGLTAVLAEVTKPSADRLAAHLADPTVTRSQAAYAAWLRRQVRAWSELRLPASSVAALDWPLASVRPQCLDIVGTIIADLRELAPRMRPTIIPSYATSPDHPRPGVTVAAVDLCVRTAAAPAQLLGPTQELTAGATHLGSATRYLTRCADLVERAPDLQRDVDRWAGEAGPAPTQLAVLTAQHLASRLVDVLEARAGW
jgi:hypothetical protein